MSFHILYMNPLILTLSLLDLFFHGFITGDGFELGWARFILYPIDALDSYDQFVQQECFKNPQVNHDKDSL